MEQDEHSSHRVVPFPTAEQHPNPILIPVPRTPLIGRDREVDLVVGLVRNVDVPLVTLTGPGGVGKTRLAMQVALTAGPGFRDGVRFVALDTVNDPDQVLPTIARALGIADEPARSTLDALTAHLGSQQMLLVLDNLEQVAAGAAALADVLYRCPGLTILATSRVVLRLSIEHGVAVAPLPIPQAVQLFVTRARASSSEFALTAANAPDITGICARLDGLPLALELAAARIPALPPAAMLSRLDAMLPILTGGARDMPPRLRTMRSTMDWSYQLLSPVEQILFARLSVFAGSFALESAEGVCHWLSHPEHGEPSTFRLPPNVTMLDIVQSLVDHSLLRQVPDAPAGEPRYRMLQAIREYGLLLLADNAEAGQVRTAHVHHFVDMAERLARRIDDPGYESILDRLDRDYENVVEALSFAGASPLGVRLAEAMGRYWAARGLYREGRMWLERSLGDTDPTPPTHERLLALRSAGWQARLQGDTGAALRLQTRALQGARRTDDQVNMVGALQELALVHMHTGQDEVAVQEMQEALSLSLQMEGAIDDGSQVVSVVQANVAQVTLASGDPATALPHAEDAIARQRSLGYHWALCDTLRIQGDILLELGQVEPALAAYKESIDISKDHGDVRFLANALAGIALLSARRGDAVRSARLYAASGVLYEQIGAGIEVWQRVRHDKAIANVQRDLPAAEFSRHWETGRSRSLDETIADATSTAMDAVPDAVVPSPISRLSGREIEVLRLLTRGMTDREIGEALSISPRTASYHVTNLLTKLDLDSRTSAAAFAIRQGLD